MQKLVLRLIAVGLVLATSNGVGVAASPKAADPLVESYLAIHESLAADSTTGVAASAQKLAAEARRRAQDGTEKELLSQVATAASTLKGNDLETLRARFEGLSRAMVAYLEAVPAEGLGVYYCPMKKAHWVQKAGPVKNPYYGKSMLACGNQVTQ